MHRELLPRSSREICFSDFRSLFARQESNENNVLYPAFIIHFEEKNKIKHFAFL